MAIRVASVQATDIGEGGGENFAVMREPPNDQLGDGMVNLRGSKFFI